MTLREIREHQAWKLLSLYVVFNMLLLGAGIGKISNVIFLITTLGLGLFFYVRKPIFYFCFVWWLWILTPMVRRLFDYRNGFVDPSPILLAPQIVTFFSVITILRCLPQVLTSRYFPFFLSASGAVYGLLVGYIYRTPDVVSLSFLSWINPVLFGFHILLTWKQYPAYRASFERLMVVAVLTMGGYGILQYLLAPDWDRLWLINAGMASIGRPEPLGIRVWSTLNSPRPFGGVMMGGLLLIFASRSPIQIPASVVGYISFLLALTRAPWGGWVIGACYTLVSSKSKHQLRLIAILLTLGGLILSLASMDPFADRIGSRLSSFSEIEGDGSAQARQETYSQLLDEALTSWFGQGIGGPTHDSAVLSTLFNLGWFGTLMYLGGILLICYDLFRPDLGPNDTFSIALRGVTLGTLAQIPLGVPMLGAQGVMLWSCFGLAIAHKTYYQFQIPKPDPT